MQEASDYVDHELLTNRFHVTHYAGCAVLFNKDTFYANVDVKSINLHDTRRDLPDQVMEGDQGWVLQGVLSRASFRRSPVSGQKCFAVLSLHISNIYAKKKGIAKKLILTLRAFMISQEVDLVAGDFNGTAWHCRSKDNLSTVDEAFTDSTLPTPRGPTPLWGPGSIPNNWADVCGFLKPPGSQQDVYEQRIFLKERPAECSYGNPKRRIREVMSDHLLSSFMCDHSHHGLFSLQVVTIHRLGLRFLHH